jgi:hypothetical protein
MEQGTVHYGRMRAAGRKKGSVIDGSGIIVTCVLGISD